ncbi:MAG: transcriptional regulator GcvA [Alphaproteobacteria bacterium]|nr:transcriptional regulator GcvA [Alphaproteobacteria bacterium]
MFSHLPSICQLRAFETSARYLSFTKAAKELFLTQSAISHQIKGLEELVHQKLFLRQNRRLILTRPGQEFLITVRKILPTLHRSVEKMRQGNASKKITISTLPSIAATWLVAKLGRLRGAFPEIDLMVIASDTPDNFNSDNAIDFAIHFTHPISKGLWQRKMMDEYYLPVCAPALRNNPKLPLRDPSDLRHHTLIHQDETLGWNGWFSHYELNDITPSRILSFNHGDLAIQAAVDGQGVALVRRVMAQHALAQNNLVPLFNMPVPTRRKYFILAPQETTENAMIMQVIEWLCKEAVYDEKTMKNENF